MGFIIIHGPGSLVAAHDPSVADGRAILFNMLGCRRQITPPTLGNIGKVDDDRIPFTTAAPAITPRTLDSALIRKRIAMVRPHPRLPIRRRLVRVVCRRRPRRHPSTHQSRHHDKTGDRTHPPPTTPQPTPHTDTTNHQRLNPDKNTRLELGRGTTAPPQHNSEND